MGWITLADRTGFLEIEANNLELRDLQLSRERRLIQKNSSYQQSIFNKNKKNELAKAKSAYEKVKNERPVGDDGKIDTSSDEYATWQQDYALAKETFEAAKLEIENFYSDKQSELEEETTDKENEIDDEKTDVESQLDSVKSEKETTKEQISTDISQTKLDLA